MREQAARSTPALAPGPAVPRTGNRLTRWLARAILRLLGWRVTGELPDLPKFVIIAAPHTSNWDFVYGALAKAAMGLRVRFLGKDTLFRPPLGWVMRWLGGQPVDRANPHGVVDETVEAIRQAPSFVLALAPEGTRKRVTRWRTGFHRVAVAAEIPIVLAAFDYAAREVHLGPLLWPGENLGADLERINAYYRGRQGKRPQLFAPAAGGE